MRAMRAETARRLAPLLAALSMLGPFSIDTFFPAFRVMSAELGVSPQAMQQTLSVYLAAYALMSLFHGPLSDAHGRRRPVLIATALFALASAGCTLATDFTSLLVFRALQGLAAGAGMIIGRAIIRDRFAGADAQRLMSQVSMIFGIAPAIAPVVGGWLLGIGGWRSIFAALAAFSALVWLAALRWLPETLPRSLRVAFVPASLLRSYGAMLGDTVFRRLSLALTFNFGAVFLYIASAPVFVMDVLALDERSFAWLFIPVIGGLTLGAFIASRLAGRRSAPQTLALAYQLIFAGAVANLMVSAFALPSVPMSVLPLFLGAIGVAIGSPTMNLMVLDRFPATRGTASSLQAAFTLLFNAMLAGLLSPLVAHRPLLLAAVAATMSVAGSFAWRSAWWRMQAHGEQRAIL